ncbi:hypothetical protein WA026_001987 [Henosepilachna vigintioctopunctata]|uniref:Nudix hydrolase domain-containing protein n=2 Tax=Henosepilachna vigintioctopunctata TaxID=420089 RepID=A0AAW1USM9_9CUCU
MISGSITSVLKPMLGLGKKRYVTTLFEFLQRKMATSFFGAEDRFRGITVDSKVEQCVLSDFPNLLKESITQWKKNNKRTIWFKVHLDQSDWVPLLAKNGFKFHHAKEDYVMMYLWMPKDELKNIPNYAHTLLGVGGIVVNDKSQVLVVKEKYATRTFWKLPGGYVEPGENLVDAAMREVLEETNISTEFQSLISFNHSHGRAFGCSDIYVVVNLKPTSYEIKKSDQEISECIWMDIQDYLTHPEIHALNKLLLEKYLQYKNNEISIDCVSGIHQTLNIPFCFYSVRDSKKSISDVGKQLKIS